MRILVTGSEGSLMQAVIPKLIAQGHEVMGVDSLFRYGERAKSDGYLFRQADLVDWASVEEIFDDFYPEAVIQAAARIYGVGGFNAYRADILGEDITLHNNILKAAHRVNTKRVVYISSSMVYENCKGQHAAKEEDPDKVPAPFTDYGLSKFTGERLSKAFCEQYNIDYTIWRPFNIITPHEKVTTNEIGVSHVFADYIENIIVKKMNPLPIIGKGLQIRCFTWIDDVATAIADYSFSDKTRNETFNIGNPEPISMMHLAELIHEYGMNEGILERKPLGFKTVLEFPNDVEYRVPDINKITNKLGWQPTVKVADSIRMCLADRS